MRPPIELGEAPAQAVLDGAVGLALATGVPLRLQGPLNGADLALVLAAAKLGGEIDAAALSKPGAPSPPPPSR